MSSVFVERHVYKPFEYPWAFDYYLTQNKMHWLPEEVPLHEDVRDWNGSLEKEEKEVLTRIFRFFTQGDVDIAGAYVTKYMPLFPKPELRMMLSSFAAMEAVHAHAYSLLIDTLGLPESEYGAFLEHKELKDKHDYLFNYKVEGASKEQKRLFDIAVFSAFGEGLQLFSSFAILLNFQRFNKMKGMGQIVTWSIRDESLHVEAMLRLYNEILAENPKLWTKKFQEGLVAVGTSMVDLEMNFIDLVFNRIEGIEGLTKEDIKEYVRYIADRRFIQLGLKGIYNVRKNPLPWLDWILNGVEHTNFFENRSTEYAKASLTGDWDFDSYFAQGELQK